MEIIDDKAVVFRTRNPEKYKIIPKHKVIERDDGGFDVAVYWGLDEARVLKNLGVKDIQSPITRRYKWPGRYRPMQHQVETASFLTMHKRAFCFNDPGTGKTLAALWAADYLMTLGFVKRVLILCPLSIMHSAWLSDLNNSIIHRCVDGLSTDLSVFHRLVVGVLYALASSTITRSKRPSLTTSSAIRFNPS